MKDHKNLPNDEDAGAPISATPTVIIITAAFLVYLAYFFRQKTTKPVIEKGSLMARKKPLSRSALDDKNTTCQSSECVRCHKYEVVRSQAAKKFAQFKHFTGDQGLDRISASISNLESLSANPLQQPNVLYVPGLRGIPFWSQKEFDRETRLLERQWNEIACEFEDVYLPNGIDSDLVGWTLNTTASGSWMVYYLYNQGKRIDENCRRCPRTTAVIESLSSFMRNCIFGNAMFSVLMPGTTVSEHYGPCNIRIRCHLGLIVPGTSNLKVGTETQTWNLGCCLYFDDSFLHSTVNIGQSNDSIRAILLLDLWHPDLTMKERDALHSVF